MQILNAYIYLASVYINYAHALTPTYLSKHIARQLET